MLILLLFAFPFTFFTALLGKYQKELALHTVCIVIGVVHAFVIDLARRTQQLGSEFPEPSVPILG